MFCNQQATQKIDRGEEYYSVHMLKPEHYNTIQKFHTAKQKSPTEMATLKRKELN